MTPLEEAIQEIEGRTWSSLPFLKDIGVYIRTGDKRALARIKSSSDGWVWGSPLDQAISAPDALSEQDRRALHCLVAGDLTNHIGRWLRRSIEASPPDENFHEIVRAELLSRQVPERAIIGMTARYVDCFLREGVATSAGRYLLSLSDDDLQFAAQEAIDNANIRRFLELLIDCAEHRVPRLLAAICQPSTGEHSLLDIAGTLLGKRPETYHPTASSIFREVLKSPHLKFQLGEMLAAAVPAIYREEALEAARACLAESNDEHTLHCHGHAGEWMVRNFGEAALEDLVRHLQGQDRTHQGKDQIVFAATEALGEKALPAILAAIGSESPRARLAALACLIEVGGETQAQVIRAAFERGFQESEPEAVMQFLELATHWEVRQAAEILWPLLGHKSKPVRHLAARTLAQLGAGAIPQVQELFRKGKAAARGAGVTLLVALNTPAALEALENRLDAEPDDDVRDQILLGLEEAWTKSGRKVTRKDIEKRVRKAKSKLEAFVVPWLDMASLPRLRFTDGKPLSPDTVRYLLYRQSRAKEIRPDVEAKPLFELIDRQTSGDFAFQVLQALLATKADAADRWALTLAGLLGDDRIVSLLLPQVQAWAETSRGKMAEYAVQALALLKSDFALLAVDSVAMRFRTKLRNVGRAAEEAFAAAADELGITPEELGDRVVPWLGFEPGKPRVVECGGRRIEARIRPDFKLTLHDLEKGKPVASLPKTAPPDTLAEFKNLGATLREVVKAQKLRLENLLVRQHRWPVRRWQELFLGHPVLLPFAVRLVWGVYDASGKLQRTFRGLEDRSLTGPDDSACEVPEDGSIGIVHPLELDGDARRGWLTHLADYEVEPPFPQMERQVVQVKPEGRESKFFTAIRGTKINGMTFRGRAERLGWRRGSVGDGGWISAYWKSFSAAGADAFLMLEGMFVGIDMYSEIKLLDAFFVRGGSVRIGGYVYYEPPKEDDPRLLPFGQVPPIVFSEVMADLQKIAGKGEEGGMVDGK